MRRPTTAILGWIILLGLSGILPSPLLAGDSTGNASPDYSSALPVPFGPGEVLTYKIKLGIFAIGESSMRVSAIEPTRGIPTYAVEWRIKGGIPFYKMDTRFQSWIDIERLASLRFIQDQHEGSYTRFREFQFFPEQALWKRVDNDKQGPLASPLPLDDLSFIYFARSLDLQVGKEYRFNRYFKESGNPVILKVLRRDQRLVPAGTFQTIVVQPIIRTTGLFSEGGKAELHLSDDARRILVYLKTEVPGISLTMHLKSIRMGVPIHGDPLTRATVRSGPHP
jgi:hypothetical protein